MGQDLGQIKAPTKKERDFHRAVEFISDLQHGSASHSCSTNWRVSWSLAGFFKYYLCSHSASFSASVHCSLACASGWSSGLFVSQSCSLVWRCRLSLARYSPCKDGPAALPINTSVCLGWLMLFSDTLKAPRGNKDLSSCCMFQLWHAL